MYDPEIFAQGAHGLLLAEWRVRLETPLVIRNGESLAFAEGDEQKSRGVDLRLLWQNASGAPHQHEVAALYDGYEVVDGRLLAYHLAPASSVRGALRSWLIQHI